MGKPKNPTPNNDWETPRYFYDPLHKKYRFDFDPCPIDWDGDPATDGLKIDWGKRNFVNPPYSLKLKTAFVMKALEESRKGKLCILLLPVSTSTDLFKLHIEPMVKGKINFLHKRLKFAGIDKKGRYVNWEHGTRPLPPNVETISNSGTFDSMLIELKRPPLKKRNRNDRKLLRPRT